MNSIDATDFLNSLLRQDVETVREWLHSIIEKKAKPPDHFNWLGFAYVSACLLESHPQPIDKDLSFWLSIEDDLL